MRAGEGADQHQPSSAAIAPVTCRGTRAGASRAWPAGPRRHRRSDGPGAPARRCPRWSTWSRSETARRRPALMPVSDSGACPAIVRASAMVADSISAAGTTWWTMPISRARSGGHRLADEEQLARPRGADDLDELLQERKRHDEADAHQRHAEARGLGGDAQVAVQRQLAAARDRVAVHHGDRGMARALHPLQDLRDAALRVGGAAALAHLAQVHARAEGAARAAHHHDPDARIGVELVEARAQPAEQRRAHRIALLRAVEGDGGDAVHDLGEDLVGHGFT